MSESVGISNPAPWTQLEWDLADRLRKALRISGVGVQQMAEVLDVDRNTVGRYINGHSRPGRATIAAWAMMTRVPFAWLESGDVPEGEEPTDLVGMFDAGRRPGVGGGATLLPVDEGGAPSGTRTPNPLIKSQRRHLRLVGGPTISPRRVPAPVIAETQPRRHLVLVEDGAA